MQKTILCYGDSNTWGYVPLNPADKNTTIKRYPRNIRWTGVLQKLLGEDFYVVEEGLNSRTTNIDYQIPPDRNGKTYLPSCLYTHAPIDLVILALGGNDLKIYFNRTAKDIRDGLAELVSIIQTSCYGSKMQQPPKILLMSLPKFSPSIANCIDDNGIAIFSRVKERAKGLADQYEQLAQETGCYFLDISQAIEPSTIDGLHLDEATHKQLAEMVFEKIKECF